MLKIAAWASFAALCLLCGAQEQVIAAAHHLDWERRFPNYVTSEAVYGAEALPTARVRHPTLR